MIYKKLLKPLFFRMNPESAHHFVMHSMRSAGRIPGFLPLLQSMFDVEDAPELAMEIAGIHFRHPIGLAAGLDKNAEAVDAFSSIGFSFVEVGTVTPYAQPGNDRPRLFRLLEDDALINRMGFNNAGAEAMKNHLQHVRRTVPIGINIGKNKNTPNELAFDDYQKCIRILYESGDFFVVNISSPNTPDLRKLQHGDSLAQLLTAVRDEIELQQQGDRGKKPFFLKIAPDLTEAELDEIVHTAMDVGVSGIIATNTTLSREHLKSPLRSEQGGLSGKPLKDRSTEMIKMIYKRTEGRLPIIGVGGIFSGRDAYEKICAGASLLEIYTSLIYEGPAVIRDIHRYLREQLMKDGFQHLSEAVGTSVR